MFKEVNVELSPVTNYGYENITLWDTHDIRINRHGNDAELVIHPCHIGQLKVRYAKEPYVCRIWLGKNESRVIDIGDESDWGNIDIDDFKHPKWGNDDDGYRKITKVDLNDGFPTGTIVPLEQFSQDVEDQMMYFEC